MYVRGLDGIYGWLRGFCWCGVGFWEEWGGGVRVARQGEDFRDSARCALVNGEE